MVQPGSVQRVGQVVVFIAAVAAQVIGGVKLACSVVDGLRGVHLTAHGSHRLRHIGHGRSVQGAAGGRLCGSSPAQLLHAAFGGSHDGGLLGVISHRVAAVVDERELHGLNIVAVVVHIIGVLGFGDGGRALGAVSHLQQGLGLLSVEQVGLHSSLGDAVGCVQIAVGAPQAVGGFGGLGGGGVIQNTVLRGKLLFHGGVVLDGAGGQLGHILAARGGDLLAVDGTGAGGLQHGFDIGGCLAGRKLGQTGRGVVGVILGQQVDAGRDVDPADGANGGRRGHGAARQRQHHGNSHGKAEQFGFDGTHKWFSPLIYFRRGRTPQHKCYYTAFLPLLQPLRGCDILVKNV